MKTPTGKAIELIDKYRSLWSGMDKSFAKQCALITVNEIIKEHCHESGNKNPAAQDRWIEYWQEVKQKIENS